MRRETFFVYIMTNSQNKVFYTGVTNNLERRVAQHKAGKGGKFTSRYKIDKLVYYEDYSRIDDAIRREKQIKAGNRRQKIEMIERMNEGWKDLSLEF